MFTSGVAAVVRPAAMEAVLAVVVGDASPIVVVAVVGLGVVHSVRALPGLKTQREELGLLFVG